MLSIFEVCGFVVGLLFGSFLNVCISRLPRHQSIVHPGSYCPQCGAPIRGYDNIPLLSFLLLSGRCRSCKARIPWRYPLVELAFALWTSWVAAVLWFAFHPWTAATSLEAIGAVSIAVLGFLLIGLMVMDWQTMVLPDAFTLSGILLGLLFVGTQAIFLGPNDDQVILNTTHQLRLNSPGSFMSRGNVFLTGPEALIFGRMAAVCGVALLLLLIRRVYKAIRHREGMGLGDVKLLAMIAAFLGFWPAVLALFLGTFLAAVYGVVLLSRKKAGADSKLAFGSFLCAGGLISAVFGNRLIDMYTALLR